jgi:hypothetical protein
MDPAQGTYLSISISPLQKYVLFSSLLLRSTQRDMLEYVRYASGVRRIGLESNTEDIILIISCYMQIIRACLVMLEVQC